MFTAIQEPGTPALQPQPAQRQQRGPLHRRTSLSAEHVDAVGQALRWPIPWETGDTVCAEAPCSQYESPSHQTKRTAARADVVYFLRLNSKASNVLCWALLRGSRDGKSGPLFDNVDLVRRRRADESDGEGRERSIGDALQGETDVHSATVVAARRQAGILTHRFAANQRLFEQGCAQPFPGAAARARKSSDEVPRPGLQAEGARELRQLINETHASPARSISESPSRSS